MLDLSPPPLIGFEKPAIIRPSDLVRPAGFLPVIPPAALNDTVSLSYVATAQGEAYTPTQSHTVQIPSSAQSEDICIYVELTINAYNNPYPSTNYISGFTPAGQWNDGSRYLNAGYKILGASDPGSVPGAGAGGSTHRVFHVVRPSRASAVTAGGFFGGTSSASSFNLASSTPPSSGVYAFISALNPYTTSYNFTPSPASFIQRFTNTFIKTFVGLTENGTPAGHSVAVVQTQYNYPCRYLSFWLRFT